ncbi:unnamed protein product [Pedinophyceae sp. YPF-701]|nr:unnamed protein product [Pedinophyceae sp. YPF-701]
MGRKGALARSALLIGLAVALLLRAACARAPPEGARETLVRLAAAAGLPLPRSVELRSHGPERCVLELQNAASEDPAAAIELPDYCCWSFVRCQGDRRARSHADGGRGGRSADDSVSSSGTVCGLDLSSSAQGHIATADLRDGVLPFAESLEFLDLSFNRLGAGLSGVLDGLRSLRTLHLRGCSVHDGLTSDIIAHPTLEDLDVSGTRLRHWELPGSSKLRARGGGSALVSLIATDAGLRGDLPDLWDFLCLPNLKALHLGGNQLRIRLPGAPEPLCPPSPLLELTLDGSAVAADAVPAWRAATPALQRLSLAGTGVGGALSDWLRLLPDSARALDLSHTRVHGAFAAAAALAPPALVQLLLAGCPGVTGTLPAAAPMLLRAEVLSLAGTGIQGAVPAGFAFAAALSAAGGAFDLSSTALAHPAGARNSRGERLPEALQLGGVLLPVDGLPGVLCPAVVPAGAERRRAAAVALPPAYHGLTRCECQGGGSPDAAGRCGGARGRELAQAGECDDPDAGLVIAVIVLSAALLLSLGALAALALRHLLRPALLRRMPVGWAAVVVTDIKGSTELWEWNARVMNVAQAEHDTVMRRCVARHRGVELFTEGDSFTLAFGSTLDAVKFCWDAQSTLNDHAWDSELLEHPLGKVEYPGGDDTRPPLIRGLRVRMGLSCGTFRKVQAASTTEARSRARVERTGSVASSASGGSAGRGRGGPGRKHKGTSGAAMYEGTALELATAVQDAADGGQLLVDEATFESEILPLLGELASFAHSSGTAGQGALMLDSDARRGRNYSRSFQGASPSANMSMAGEGGSVRTGATASRERNAPGLAAPSRSSLMERLSFWMRRGKMAEGRSRGGGGGKPQGNDALDDSGRGLRPSGPVSQGSFAPMPREPSRLSQVRARAGNVASVDLPRAGGDAPEHVSKISRASSAASKGASGASAASDHAADPPGGVSRARPTSPNAPPRAPPGLRHASYTVGLRPAVRRGEHQAASMTQGQPAGTTGWRMPGSNPNIRKSIAISEANSPNESGVNSSQLASGTMSRNQAGRGSADHGLFSAPSLGEGGEFMGGFPLTMVLHMGEHRLSCRSLTGPIGLIQLLPPAFLGRTQLFLPPATIECPGPPVTTAPCIDEYIDHAYRHALLQAGEIAPRLAHRSEVVVSFVSVAGWNSVASRLAKREGGQAVAENSLWLYISLIRATAPCFSGYVCRQKEAVLLLSWPTPVAAVEWAVMFQEALLMLRWQPALEEFAETATEDVGTKLAFRGLRAQVGIYAGVPELAMPHPAHGRAEYYGPFINRAARLCHGIARNGQVLASKGVAEAAMSDWCSRGPKTKLVGDREFRREILKASSGLQVAEHNGDDGAPSPPRNKARAASSAEALDSEGVLVETTATATATAETAAPTRRDVTFQADPPRGVRSGNELANVALQANAGASSETLGKRPSGGPMPAPFSRSPHLDHLMLPAAQTNSAHVHMRGRRHPSAMVASGIAGPGASPIAAGSGREDAFGRRTVIGSLASRGSMLADGTDMIVHRALLDHMQSVLGAEARQKAPLREVVVHHDGTYALHGVEVPVDVFSVSTALLAGRVAGALRTSRKARLVSPGNKQSDIVRVALPDLGVEGLQASRQQEVMREMAIANEHARRFRLAPTPLKPMGP